MKKRHIRDTPAELHVPYGYEFDDLYDTETPEELGEPIKEEEVQISFGRKDDK
jgi:hypothetical protein